MDYPPLLPAGLHVRTWAELEALCVKAFPLSGSRPRLMAGLRVLIDELCAAGIVGDLWVDGSFLTRKIEPGDVDCVLRLAPQVYKDGTPAQRALIEALAKQDESERARIKRDYGCDAYVFLDEPAWDGRQYWLNQFGNDRSANVKGIASLSIPGGVR